MEKCTNSECESKALVRVSDQTGPRTVEYLECKKCFEKHPFIDKEKVYLRFEEKDVIITIEHLDKEGTVHDLTQEIKVSENVAMQLSQLLTREYVFR